MFLTITKANFHFQKQAAITNNMSQRTLQISISKDTQDKLQSTYMWLLNKS